HGCGIVARGRVHGPRPRTWPGTRSPERFLVALAGLPVSEHPEQSRFGLRTDVGRGQRTGELDRLPHLPDVLAAARAPLDVVLEAVALGFGQRALEIVRHQLDELLATQLFDACAHWASTR